MVNPLASRATSDQLIGPDWAMNLEICNILNRDPGQAKDVIRGLKKRIRHKNSKVQLLALTLLETVVKNCGDVVHIHVAERGILLEMVKIVKKKPDFQVKEKILVLIDTWQEAFGGPRARYPQYYAAYQELLRSGAVIPQKSENVVPIFTPPQTHPLTSYPQNLHNSEVQQGATESSMASDLPTMSLSEVQNAHGIMDVLSEMLNALDPGNREGPKQEVIVDLVEQCRAYKQRVVQLVNTTADEELLRQGLTLNDDLERVLAKHDAISSGTAARMDKQKSLAGLVDVDDTNSKLMDQGSTSAGEAQNPLKQLLLPGPDAPRNSNGNLSLVKVDPHMDLLSGDLNPPSTTDENALALVPVSQPTTNAAPAVQMDLIVLGDMFPETSGGTAPNISKSTTLGSASTAATPTLQQQSLHTVSHSNGSSTYNLGQSSAYAPMSLWNGPVAQNPEQQQTIFGAPSGNENALPPPPWESQPSEIIQQMQTSNPLMGTVPPVGSTYSNQSMMNIQQTGVGIYTQPGMPALQQPGGMGIYPPQMHTGLQSGALSQSGQVGYPMGAVPMHSQPIQSGQLMGVTYYPQMQNGQPLGMYQQPVGLVGMTMQTFQSGQFGGYGYGQWPNAQPLGQRMFGPAVHDSHGGYNSTSYQTSYAPSKKPSKPEDKLFGNLVSFAKSKPSNLNSGKSGSL